MNTVEWLTSEAAARVLGYVDPETGAVNLRAFDAYVRRASKAETNPLRIYRVGRRLRFKASDIARRVEAR